MELESFRKRLFRDLDRVVEALDGLDEARLTWHPYEQGTSLLVLVGHVHGSAMNTVLQLAGLESSRDRDGEFLRPWDPGTFRAQAAAAKARMTEAFARIDPATLDVERPAPATSVAPLTLKPVTTQQAGARTARDYLLQVLAHTAEHVGQAELTRSLASSPHFLRDGS